MRANLTQKLDNVNFFVEFLTIHARIRRSYLALRRDSKNVNILWKACFG